jgi:hypothetical protein
VARNDDDSKKKKALPLFVSMNALLFSMQYRQAKMLLAHSIILSYPAPLNSLSDIMVNTTMTDNLLWFVQSSHNGSSESFNKSKNLVASA